MTDNSVVRARIDEHVKDEAAAVLMAMGLTVSDATVVEFVLEEEEEEEVDGVTRVTVTESPGVATDRPLAMAPKP